MYCNRIALPLAALCSLLCAGAWGVETPDSRLIPDDVLSITVLEHEDLTREVTIPADGVIRYPIAGQVTAAGRTVDDVAADITRGLKGELFEPEVTVSLKTAAMRRVYATGMVGKPGAYDLKPGWQVSHLIAEAGGLVGRTELLKASISRGAKLLPVDLASVMAQTGQAADAALEPGDVLAVQSDTNLIHVVGQVKAPGDYQLKSNLGVLEAMGLAGGATEKAALSKAQVLRGRNTIAVDLYQLLNLGKTESNVALQAGDTLVVPEATERYAVLGGVQGPGVFDLVGGKPIYVTDALAAARGANRRAILDRVSLVRNVDGKQVVTTLNIKRFLREGDATQNPEIHGGDIIYVIDGREGPSNSLLTAVGTALAGALSWRLVR